MNIKAIYNIPRIHCTFYITDKRASDKYVEEPLSNNRKDKFLQILRSKHYRSYTLLKCEEIISEKEFFEVFRQQQISPGWSVDKIIENLELYTINRNSNDLKELGQIPSEDILEINI